jgi:hypothetical protein
MIERSAPRCETIRIHLIIIIEHFRRFQSLSCPFACLLVYMALHIIFFPSRGQYFQRAGIRQHFMIEHLP